MRVVILAIAVGGLLLSATASGHTTLSAKPCFAIFLRDSATAAQKKAIGTRLGRDAMVAAFRYVSKASALEELRRTSPELVAALTENPLPNSFRVRVRSGVDALRAAKHYVALHLKGVENVIAASSLLARPSRCP